MNINTTSLKAVAVGIVTGPLAAALFVVGGAVLTLTLSNWREAAGSAGIGAVSIGFSLPELVLVLLVGVAGFAGGFRWTLRRARRRESLRP